MKNDHSNRFHEAGAYVRHDQRDWLTCQSGRNADNNTLIDQVNTL